MSTPIACLSFDFDTWSGFVARGMATPTPVSRGRAHRMTMLEKPIDGLAGRGAVFRTLGNVEQLFRTGIGGPSA